MALSDTSLVLGTALWGWTVSRKMAFDLLEEFYDAGGRAIDTAVNYPINKVPGDFGASLALLEQWCCAHGVTDLQVTLKVGSIKNDATAANDLSAPALTATLDRPRQVLDSNLAVIMVHWDNRYDPATIDETLDVLRSVRWEGFDIGLSGIRHPEMYHRQAPDLADIWQIQIKHNLLSDEAYRHYNLFHGVRRFYAYGINAGGISFGKKHTETSSRTVRGLLGDNDLSPFRAFIEALPPDSPLVPESFNQLSMLYTHNSPDMAGLIIGPSRVSQLKESLVFHARLRETDTHAIYRALKALASGHSSSALGDEKKTGGGTGSSPPASNMPSTATNGAAPGSSPDDSAARLPRSPRGGQRAVMRHVDVAIIGGGFYGCEIALEMKRCGADRVLIIEREPGLMRRASYVNQARVHNGYHYPRSFTTGLRSRENFYRFLDDYSYAIEWGMQMIYAVARGSRVTAVQFEKFCKAIGAPCRPARPALHRLFNSDLIEETFETEELAFNIAAIAENLVDRLKKAKVELILGRTARISWIDELAIRLDIDDGQVWARHVFNCTYADLDGAGIRLRNGLKRELAELVLIEPPDALKGIGVTVMDGPFFSTMPFPAAGCHSLSHVRYTPHGSWTDPNEALVPVRSNRDLMIRDSARYLPALADARVLRSIFDIKAVLVRNEDDDARPILLEQSDESDRILSVMGSKIDNIYDVLAYLRGRPWGD